MASHSSASSTSHATPLPMHNSNHPQDGYVSREEHKEFLKAKYDEADVKLCKLEEELDFVIYCASVIRERRSELVQKSLKYSDATPHERKLEGDDNIIDDYLQLLDKGKKLDDETEALKKECSDARTHCSNLFGKYHYYFHRHTKFSTFENKRVMNVDTFGGAHGTTYADLLVRLDASSAMDRKEKSKRMIEGRQMRRNLATAVGALGASIAFTTLFSATRGRLDLIAWAFTSFIFAVFVSALPQGYHSQNKASQARREYMGSHNRLAFVLGDIVLLLLPLPSGMVLLVLAVALLDASALAPVPGSQTTIRFAGFITLGGMLFVATCFITINSISRVRRSFRPSVQLPTERDYDGNNSEDKMDGHYPSHLLPRDSPDRWSFLPGGADFFKYRRWRRSQAMTEKFSCLLVSVSSRPGCLSHCRPTSQPVSNVIVKDPPLF